MRDGDGWQRCSLGHDHWGVYGAAGLLVVAPGPSRESMLLLQHRAAWSHHGGTWGLPGGARGRQESAVQAALREAREETGLDVGAVVVLDELVDDHGQWSYTTVVARAAEQLPVHALDRETEGVRWVAAGSVEALPLHPGFAATWPALRAVAQVDPML